MFDNEEKPNASKKETDGAAAFPVYAAGDAANDRFCGGCTGCANKSEAGTDRNRLKSLLEEKPETFDPKKLGVVAMEAVKEQVIARMKMCGCDGKAE